MKSILRNYRPFQYMVKNKKNELEEYSGGFLTREEALAWYYENGVWLEQQFKRQLILVENKRLQLNLF
jgi:hypothetical protein